MLTCPSCGYLLTVADPQRRCPECGAPVAEAIEAQRNPLLDAAWQRRFALWARVLAWALLASLAPAFLEFMSAAALPVLPFVVEIEALAVAGFIAWIAVLAATWFVAARPGGAVRPWKPSALAMRTLIVALPAVTMGVAAIRQVMGASALSEVVANAPVVVVFVALLTSVAIHVRRIANWAGAKHAAPVMLAMILLGAAWAAGHVAVSAWVVHAAWVAPIGGAAAALEKVMWTVHQALPLVAAAWKAIAAAALFRTVTLVRALPEEALAAPQSSPPTTTHAAP